MPSCRTLFHGHPGSFAPGVGPDDMRESAGEAFMFPEQVRLAALCPGKEDQMTERLTRLLDLDAVSGDDRFPIRALFHDEVSRRLKAAAVDVGGWLDRREILVTLDRFGSPEADTWPMTLGRDEMESAPEWEHTDSASMGLPPLIIGPFGYTFSPLLMAAGMNASAERSLPDTPGSSERAVVESEDGRFAGLIRTADWLNRDAFGPQGHLGQVADVELDDELKIVALVLDDDRIIAMTRMRNLTGQGHFVFD